MSNSPPIRLATRASALALWQARRVADLIRQIDPGQRVELVEITTKPDRLPDTPLQTMGGDKGLFVKELEQTLLDGGADAAVHSLKDVPVDVNPAGLELVAFPERANPADVLLLFDDESVDSAVALDKLAAGATVATSSLRRKAQLLRLRPDIQTVGVRGNIDTRIRKLKSGEFDAMILAAAGLERLALHHHVSLQFSFDDFLPAPGQGILAVQAPEDSRFCDLWKALDSPMVRHQALAERAFSLAIGATCHTAAACLFQINGAAADFRGAVYSSDGRQAFTAMATGCVDDALNLARSTAQELLDKGCKTVL